MVRLGDFGFSKFTMAKTRSDCCVSNIVQIEFQTISIQKSKQFKLTILYENRFAVTPRFMFSLRMSPTGFRDKETVLVTAVIFFSLLIFLVLLTSLLRGLYSLGLFQRFLNHECGASVDCRGW